MRCRSVGLALTVVMVSTAVSATAGAREFGSESEGSRQRAFGLVVASLGLVGFGASVYLGRDRAKRDDTGAHCSVDVCQSMASLLVEDARAQNNTAFRLMSTSLLTMAGGVAIYFLAPSQKRSGVLAGASVGLGPGGLTFKTTF
ncbi:MAG: hypothetical protein ACXWUG_24585 [Polyangiales bacterium]